MSVKQIVPNLWFDTQAEEAAAFYCSVFDDAVVTNVTRYTEAGPREPGTVMTVEWRIGDQRFVGINGGPEFTFSEAVSFMVECEDQAGIDRFWKALAAEEGPCGWCRDRFGVSWQVVPKGMDDLFADPDQSKASRAMTAMFGMKKLDIAALEAAAVG